MATGEARALTWHDQLGYWNAGDIAMCGGKAVRVIEPDLHNVGHYHIEYLKSKTKALVHHNDLYHVSEP